MESWNIHEAVEYYKGQDAPQNQFALVELLKEVQEHNGGVLTDIAVEEIAALLNTKVTFLKRRYQTLSQFKTGLCSTPIGSLRRQKLRRQRFGSAA